MPTSTPALPGSVSPHPTPVSEEIIVPGDSSRSPHPDLRNPMNVPASHVAWWRKPSPWWLLCMMPFAAIAVSATLAPRVEIYTTLACRVHRPDIYDQDFSGTAADRAVSKIIPSYYVSSSVLGIHNLGTRESKSNGLVEGKRCASDPVVQAAVAKLSAVITTSTGILSSLTGAWWGAFSDRHGRTKILGITVVGALITDLNFILVTTFSDKLPDCYWFLVVGPLIEGLLGGLASGTAASHAYMADTTTEETRSRFFSLNLGLLYVGFGLGPVIGGLLLRTTGQVLSVFFLSAAIHMAYALFMWFVVPEPLTMEQMQNSMKKHEERLHRSQHDHNTYLAATYIKRTFQFLSPLTIFIPSRKAGTGRDWSLTLMALSYGLIYLLLANTNYAVQYMAASFGWSSETIGYYISLMGIVRAVQLMVIVPVLIKYLKPEPRVALEVPPEEEPLLSTTSLNTNVVQTELHSLSFDMLLARVSIAIETIAYGAMGLSSSGLPFVISSVFLWMGSAVNPAVQSVALAIYTRNGGTESGRLFGALSVVQALCSQMIGPALFGFVYASTVASFPQVIFFVSAIGLFIALLCLCLIRLDGRGRSGVPDIGDDNEELNAGTGEEGPLIPQIRIIAAED